MGDERIDFAAVKADHEGHAPGCVSKWGKQPCLPYRLAADAERLAGERDQAVQSTLRWVVVNGDDSVMLAQMRLDSAALADQPEQVQS